MIGAEKGKHAKADSGQACMSTYSRNPSYIN